MPRFTPVRSSLAVAASLVLSLLLVIASGLTGLPARQNDIRAAERGPNSVVPSDRHPHRLLLGLPSGLSYDQLAQQLAPYELMIEHHWPAFDLAAVVPTVRSAQLADAYAASATLHSRLADSGVFRYVDFDGAVQIAAEPNDPRLPEQWAIPAVSALAARDITVGDARVVIAVIDTGYSPDHEDLGRARLWINRHEEAGLDGVDDDENGYIDDIHGWDWVGKDNDPVDENGHGTHVTGIIAALTDNAVGIAGVGGDLTIAPLRVLDRYGSGYISDLVSALDYARTQGFRIINLSLTVSTNFPALHDAIKTVHAEGALIVTATGNAGSSVAYPASYAETVAVAATRASGDRAGFSNFGLAVDLAAPGESVLSTHLNDSYRFLSGTSMAAPHVSALAGLIWSLRPDFTRQQVIDLMQATATDSNGQSYPGPDIYLGAGQINFAEALMAATDGLSLIADANAGQFALSEGHFATTIQVNAGDPAVTTNEDVAASSRRHVAGAVVQFEVEDLTGVPLGIGGHATTDASGAALIQFTAPSTQGDYRVTSATGVATTTFELKVHTVPITVTLTLESETVTVSEGPVNFRVTIDDPDVVVSGQDLALVVTTTVGAFANRASTMIANLGTERIYDGLFIPGTSPTTASITARVGSATSSVDVAILAGPPSTLYAPAMPPYFTIDAGDLVPLVYVIRDVFGNPVNDGTGVAVTSSSGQLAASILYTQDGEARTTIQLPLSWPEPIIVRAEVIGSQLVVENTIMPPPRLYLPGLIVSEPPELVDQTTE